MTLTGFPRLTKPDTKFVADGVFTCKLVEEADLVEEAYAPARVLIDEKFESQLRALQAGDGKAKAKAKTLDRRFNISPEYDDEGEETGRLILETFKLNHIVKYKDRRTGEAKSFKQSPKICHPNGDVMTPAEVSALRLYAGSRVILQVEYSPYYTPKDNLVGVSMRVKAVLVVNAVGGSDEGSPFSGVADTKAARIAIDTDTVHADEPTFDDDSEGAPDCGDEF
jgi:hypothetical protein